MTQCEICQEIGDYDCKFCSLGNPCLGCKDYDMDNDTCKTNGGCADYIEQGERKHDIR